MYKKVIISGGGTGGHIYPAIAIANALKESDSNIEILFVGALGKMEMQKVPQAGYRIVGLPIVGIKRSLSLANLMFPFKLINSLSKAYKIVKEFSPDVAVGVGGFASGPLLLICALLRIPILIQEQNSYAGITNKVLSKWAIKVCVAYPNMEKFFPQHKIVFTGNPVRKDILEVDSKKKYAIEKFGLREKRKILLVFGGSLGARSINEGILNGLSKLLEEGIQVIWQTGNGFLAQANHELKKLNSDNVKIFEFIDDMDLAYAAADIVVSRAGALSVSELCLIGKPAILVPYPYASEDHQTQNALSLVNQDAALMIPDATVSQLLIDTIIQLFGDNLLQKKMSENIQKLGKPHAAKVIAQEVLNIAN